MPLNTLQRIRQPPTTRNDPAQHDNCVELEKPSYSRTQTFKSVKKLKLKLKKGGGINWEIGIDIYTLLYIK